MVSDADKITELVNQLLPLMKFVKEEYVGDEDEEGRPHGYGHCNDYTQSFM